jgi:hypothetical protein
VVFRPEDAMNISADIMEQTDVFSFGDDPDFAQDSFSGVDLGIFKASVGDEVGRLRAAIREDESNHTLAVASRPVSSNSYFMVPQSR